MKINKLKKFHTQHRDQYDCGVVCLQTIEKEKQGNISINSFNSLEIRDTSFRFAGRSQLLKNVSLSVKKGEFSAIVGESGSGKSTLGQVLQKFYVLENGEISEQGSHQKLLETVNFYSDYWKEII